ncbi:MAG TPA: CocE/NonD family hydrolase [Actinomycetota bacterium]|nr:CocE/NonD family hydrolase [Actinomycetota bacterium]
MFRRARRVLPLVLLAAAMLVPVQGRAQIPGLEYILVSDGTPIAVNLQFPSGYQIGQRLPILIQIDGYGGASSPMNPNSATFGNGEYVTAHMSLRGTGCSGGQFDLFDRRSSYDGYQVIENLAKRDWSNGKVAIWGHSYSGLTGWLTAATQPPSLKAISVSGLIDDLYRGIVYMGGVSNMGFPLLWTGIYRPSSEYQNGVIPGVRSGDRTCIANQATRYPPDVLDNPILNGAAGVEDSQWWASHSTITYLDGINVPTHIVQSYQDEQTGPRGSNLLWQRLDERKPELPKRLLLTNGVHSTNTAPPEIRDDRIAFLDCHVRGVCSADILDPSQRVKVLWEMHNDGTRLRSTGVTADSDWPLRQTQWTRYYLQPNGGLSTSMPAAADTAPYVSGSKRAGAWSYLAGANQGEQLTTANLPDEARFTTVPFTTATAFAGPINMTLFATSTAPDTEFYVELNDVDAAGNVTRLQRGMLKASHRDLDPLRSDYNGDGEIIRPYHPHTNTTTKVLVPGSVYQYEIEVFPVGHVFRPGHALLIRVTQPPANDSLATYVPTTPPGVNTVLIGGDFASSILLPLVPAATVGGPDLGCGKQVGLERCSKPVL